MKFKPKYDRIATRSSKIPQAVWDKLKEWYEENYLPLWIVEEQDCWHAAVRSWHVQLLDFPGEEEIECNSLQFVRIFKIMDHWAISIDQEYELL